jgi:hypothetical protein
MNMNKRVNPYAHLNLRRQLYLECRAMAEFALSKGKSIPPAVVRDIEAFENEMARCEAQNEDDNTSSLTPLRAIEELVQAHAVLVKIIEPATPKTILLLDMEEETPGVWKFFGPVPLVRHMMFVAILSLCTFIYFVSTLKLSGGDSLSSLAGLFFLVAAAGMGASFSALYSANHYITQGTFDPAYYASYWIRFLLGVMSGVVLAIVVAKEGLSGNIDNFINSEVFRPLLAILGGFSADLVYTFLNRLVETFKSLFEGSAKDIIAARSEEARARQESQTIQNRLKIATDILRLQQELGNDMSAPELQAKLNELLQSLIPEGHHSVPPRDQS